MQYSTSHVVFEIPNARYMMISLRLIKDKARQHHSIWDDSLSFRPSELPQVGSEPTSLHCNNGPTACGYTEQA